MSEQLQLPEEADPDALNAEPGGASPGAACAICGQEVHTLPEVRACLKALGSVPERARPGG